MLVIEVPWNNNLRFSNCLKFSNLSPSPRLWILKILSYLN